MSLSILSLLIKDSNFLLIAVVAFVHGRVLVVVVHLTIVPGYSFVAFAPGTLI